MINRCAISVGYKQSFVDWINSSDPYKSPNVSLVELNKDTNIYLIEAEDIEEYKDWLRTNFLGIFEEELQAWYVDPDLWPDNLNFDNFCDFFAIQFHGMVFDTGVTDIDDHDV